MKLFRNSTIILSVILLLAAVVNSTSAQQLPALTQSQLVLPSKTVTIPLHWKGDTINEKWEPHVALLVPVRLPNCPVIFYMQFDTGSPFSMFYKNKLQAIGQQYPRAVTCSSTDTILTGFSFKAGNIPIHAKEIAVKPFGSSEINWQDKKSVLIIGTLGTDLIDNKVAIINYPAQQLVIADSLPRTIPQQRLQDFMYARRSILLPAIIKGNKTILYFDSGSSMYELLAGKTTCEQLAIPNGGVLTGKVQSWGRTLTANSLASNDSIGIGNKKIPLHYATYIEGASDAQVARMLKMGIGGLTGNKLFLQYQLVLDTKHKKFGLLQAGKGE